MVESYIKNPQDAVWEKQNVGIDQKLQMLPVKPIEEIRILRRESLKHVGRPMILNFRMAHPEHDSSRSQILLDAFNIPNLDTHKRQQLQRLTPERNRSGEDRCGSRAAMGRPIYFAVGRSRGGVAGL